MIVGLLQTQNSNKLKFSRFLIDAVNVNRLTNDYNKII